MTENPTVTIAELASFLGLHRTTLSNLAKAGVLPLKAHKIGLLEGLKLLVLHYQKAAGGRKLSASAVDAELKAVRVQKIRAEASIAELKLAEAEARLISQDEIKAAWQSILLRLRGELLAIPDRLAMTTDKTICKTVDAEIRAALTDLSGGKDE